MWRFVQHNAAESKTEESVLNLTGLRKPDIELLASIRFLLSEHVCLLLDEIAPRVVCRLAKESINERVIDRNRICGRIDWQGTIKSRATTGNDPSIYVYSKRSQIYDLPENRLFLFLLQQVREIAMHFASPDQIETTVYSKEATKQKWVTKATKTAYESGHLLRNPFISKISRLHNIPDKIIESVLKNRQPLYRQIAEIAYEYSLSKKHPLKYLKKVLGNNILEPLNPDTLYEIAVLFSILQTAISAGWRESVIGLIGGNEKTASILEKDNRQLRVYTQRLPSEMKTNSSYGNIMESYGLSERLRRPDIILEFCHGAQKHFIIVEVKRSQQRSYLADGSYKLLGYLKDFEGIVNDNTALSGFLVGWKGIIEKSYNNKLSVHLTNWQNLNGSFAEFLGIYERHSGFCG